MLSTMLGKVVATKGSNRMVRKVVKGWKVKELQEATELFLRIQSPPREERKFESEDFVRKKDASTVGLQLRVNSALCEWLLPEVRGWTMEIRESPGRKEGRNMLTPDLILSDHSPNRFC